MARSSVLTKQAFPKLLVVTAEMRSKLKNKYPFQIRVKVQSLR